jgi:radical SAM protein with 4Fe4S-binding SPASM domain
MVETLMPCRREPDAYFQALRHKLIARRVPLCGSLELTRRCNLRCVHCYAGPLATPARPELSTAQVCGLLDQIVDAGCLSLLLTGGEPLLRPDFAAVYRQAKLKGLLVTLFTNATRGDDALLALFADLPPQKVEISLYGATAATYERVTQVPGSFAQFQRGCEALLAQGVRVALKTVLMTVNADELPAMEALAAGYGVSFKVDPALFARFDGDRSVLALRVPASRAIELEFAAEERVKNWIDYHERAGVPARSDRLYNCGAGITAFHVDAFGRLQPCLMVADGGYDLTTGSFAEGWRLAVPAVVDRKVRAGSRCNGCAYRGVCGSCPAFAKLESGDEHGACDYLCALGQERLTRIHQRQAAVWSRG